jgi:hypothetical membrane protein
MDHSNINRRIGLVAAIVPVWFAAIYFALSSVRPEYRHLTKAISELGSVDAPRAWVWNLFGYILPGLAIALLGAGIRNRFAHEPRARVPTWALIASGLFMALSGVFPGDFENRTSTTMILHTVGSIGSFVVFLVSAFSFPRVMRRFAGWRHFVWPSLALAAASIFTGFLRIGSAPGLGQRLGFACYFLWVALMGYALYRDPSPSESRTELTNR